MKTLIAIFLSIYLSVQPHTQTKEKSLISTNYVVTSAGDEPDDDLEDGIFDPPTLRSAIQNANHSPGIDNITFSGVTVINVGTLPTINETVFIDGSLPNNGKVVLDGEILEGVIGLTIIGENADYSTIENISIVNFSGHAVYIDADDVAFSNSFVGTSDGIDEFGNGDILSPLSTPAVYVLGNNVEISNNVISANYGYGIRIDAPQDTSLITIENNIIGLDSSGTQARGNASGGIYSFKGSPVILDNIISDNGGAGISVTGIGNKEILFSGNFIGVDKTGKLAFGNEGTGIFTNKNSVTIEDNLVSNNRNGIVSEGINALIKSNYVGTDITGKKEMGNTFRGIKIDGDNSILGGENEAEGNLISGNGSEGVQVSSTNNTIQHNYIGVTINGDSALANGNEGIDILIGSSLNTIKYNLISGNGSEGIEFLGQNDFSTVIGNYIGTDVTGAKAIPNDDSGIIIFNGNGIIIGGEQEGEGNLISGNGTYGIYAGISISPDTLAGLEIINNKVGVDITGNNSLGNSANGVWIANKNSEISGNTISGNFSGLRIDGDNNSITANKIGVNTAGTSAIGNTWYGLDVRGDTTEIGNGNFADRNIISGNGRSGLLIHSDENIVYLNYIGTDITGETAIPNLWNGIEFNTSSSHNTVYLNLVSGNGENGIEMFYLNYGIEIFGNLIGTDINGTASIPNGESGIYAFRSDSLIIGNEGLGSSNIISGNIGSGITLKGILDASNPVGSKIWNNVVGLAIDKLTPLGNDEDGVTLDEASHVQIGDSISTNRGNIISGNGSQGISITDVNMDNEMNSDSIYVYGNLIGVNEVLNNVGNESTGIRIGGSESIFIGWYNQSNRNIIAYNDGNGISVDESQNVLIGINHIYENEFLGIDLGLDGVTENDADDSDEGANALLNFPDFINSNYNLSTNTLSLQNQFISTPSEDFVFHFYSSENCDDTGFGEGELYLGSYYASTDVDGFVQFWMDFGIDSAQVYSPTGVNITATASRLDRETSEFSECLNFKSGGGVQLPDLVLTKTDGLETVYGSDVPAMFTYKIEVKNDGSTTAYEVVLTDSIPSNLNIREVTTSKGELTLEEYVLTVELDSLLSGDSLIVTIPVETIIEEIVINKGYVTSITPEINVDNNRDTDSTSVHILVNSEEELSNLPQEFALEQNYPNPFNPNTLISYSIPKQVLVEITVYNLLGMKLSTLVNEVKAPGVYSVQWDASGLASDVYFYQIKAGDFSATKMMTLIK